MITQWLQILSVLAFLWWITPTLLKIKDKSCRTVKKAIKKVFKSKPKLIKNRALGYEYLNSRKHRLDTIKKIRSAGLI